MFLHRLSETFKNNQWFLTGMIIKWPSILDFGSQVLVTVHSMSHFVGRILNHKRRAMVCAIIPLHLDQVRSGCLAPQVIRSGNGPGQLWDWTMSQRITEACAPERAAGLDKLFQYRCTTGTNPIMWKITQEYPAHKLTNYDPFISQLPPTTSRLTSLLLTNAHDAIYFTHSLSVFQLEGGEIT